MAFVGLPGWSLSELILSNCTALSFPSETSYQMCQHSGSKRNVSVKRARCAEPGDPKGRRVMLVIVIASRDNTRSIMASSSYVHT